MNAVRIRTHVDSETLYLPELRPMIGKDVEIIVMEEPVATAGTSNLSSLAEAAGKIDLDWNAIEKLRDVSKI